MGFLLFFVSCLCDWAGGGGGAGGGGVFVCLCLCGRRDVRACGREYVYVRFPFFFLFPFFLFLFFPSCFKHTTDYIDTFFYTPAIIIPQ